MEEVRPQRSTRGKRETKPVGKNVQEECLVKVRNEVITKGMRKEEKSGMSAKFWACKNMAPDKRVREFLA